MVLGTIIVTKSLASCMRSKAAGVLPAFWLDPENLPAFDYQEAFLLIKQR